VFIVRDIPSDMLLDRFAAGDPVVEATNTTTGNSDA
jgi:hypothetical protein